MFCPKCGKENSDNAKFCGKCGASIAALSASGNVVKPASAPQSGKKQGTGAATYSSYSQVPWFRKSWFIVLSFLVFAPATLYSLFSGDIYYEKKGEMVIYSKTVKIITIVLCAWMSLWVVGKIFGMQ
jgi:zinc-ribbon domain